MLIRLGILAAVTVVLGYVSRASLVAPRSHGFPRFVAWEFLAAIFVFNFRGLDEWFRDPLCPRQIASWVLLIGSAVPALWGTILLMSRGQPSASRAGQGLFAIERTTRLVTRGIYRYVRHPLYSSLLFLGWGVFLKRPGWAVAGLAICASVMLVATAWVEESENRKYFGEDYDDYARQTARFIPFVF